MINLLLSLLYAIWDHELPLRVLLTNPYYEICTHLTGKVHLDRGQTIRTIHEFRVNDHKHVTQVDDDAGVD